MISGGVGNLFSFIKLSITCHQHILLLTWAITLYLPLITPGYHIKDFKEIYYEEWKTLKTHFIHIASVSATFNIHDTIGIGLLTRLRLDFSQLNELKLRQHIKDSARVSPMCDCGPEVHSLSFTLPFVSMSKEIPHPKSWKEYTNKCSALWIR